MKQAFNIAKQSLSSFRMQFASLAMILLITVGCNRPDAPDCFQTAGEIVSIERAFSEEIKGLELHDYIHVTIIPSDENKVIIRGPKNLLPEVITDLSDGMLFIDDENSCDFVRSFDVQPRVTVLANINSITNYSQGDIDSFGPITASRFELNNWQATGDINLEFACDSVFYQTHTGVSTAFLSGTSSYAYFYHLGFGPVDGTQLISTKTSVRSNSINDVAVYAENKLVAWIEGAGNIIYAGDPEEIVEIIEGTGEVVAE